MLGEVQTWSAPMSGISSSPRGLVISMTALALLWSGTGSACGTTYDTNPGWTFLFSDAKRFIAQDAWNSMAVYRVEDGAVVFRFKASDQICTAAISPDETLLLLGCEDAALTLWDIETGQQVWTLSGQQTGLRYVYDASFAQNGKSLIVCDERDQALILDPSTGVRTGRVSFPPLQTNIISAALSPDGATGFLIELGGRLHSFHVASGKLTDTGITGAWPVRYSVDGKYIAFRSNDSGEAEKLRVITVQQNLVKQDVGEFFRIGHIKAVADGSFLVSAKLEERIDAEGRIGYDVAGVQVWPSTGQLKRMWKYPLGPTANQRTDYLPDGLLGVSTDYKLVTHLTDLRTGESLRSIDNSANYKPILLTYTSRDLPSLWLESHGLRGTWWWIVFGCGAASFVLAGLIIVFSRRRRPSNSGPPMKA
jgi:hypothetical protein